MYLYTAWLNKGPLFASKFLAQTGSSIAHVLWVDFPFDKPTSSPMGRGSGFHNVCSVYFLILEGQNSPAVCHDCPLAATGHFAGDPVTPELNTHKTELNTNKDTQDNSL